MRPRQPAATLVIMSKQPPGQIDPTELMAFLAGFEDYPASGFELSRAARDENRPDRLVHFLEHLPGQVESEQEVVKFALEEGGLAKTSGEEPAEPPEGKLDIRAVKQTKGENHAGS